MQEQFTKASWIYLECQNKISDMHKFRVGKREVDKANLLHEFDYLLQIVMLYVGLVDSELSAPEIKFLDLVTADGDILLEYNRRMGTSYTWSSLTNSDFTKDDFHHIVDESYLIFEPKINHLIMFLASCDAFSDSNDMIYLQDKIVEILNIFIMFDGNKNHLEDGFVKYILNKLVFQKYSELKSVFEVVSKSSKLN